MVSVAILAVITITASEAWECEGSEVFQDGTCQESQFAEACYGTTEASYVDDGQCFDVPEWCWADGKDTL